MIFRKRSCPACSGDHGRGSWAVTNSSAFAPAKCKACGSNFYQSGWQWWFAVPIVAPLFLPSSLGWPVAVGGALLCMLALSVYINRRHPLLAGPRHG
jgi:hypothetical protein